MHRLELLRPADPALPPCRSSVNVTS
jgi:hypothetical protein